MKRIFTITLLALAAYSFAGTINGELVNKFNPEFTELPANHFLIEIQPGINSLKAYGLYNQQNSVDLIPDSLFQYKYSKNGKAYYLIILTSAKYNSFIISSNASFSGQYTDNIVVTYKVVAGLKNDDYFSNESESIYYNLNGIKIGNPNNYEGVLIKKSLIGTKKCIYNLH